MEEAVYVFFGVIALILTFSIIVSLVSENKEEYKIQRFSTTVDVLKSQCDYVCSLPEGTLLGIDVEIPSGILLSSGQVEAHTICATYKEESRCSQCDCAVGTYILNLTSQTAKKAFETHNYRCYFERVEHNNVKMECKG